MRCSAEYCIHGLGWFYLFPFIFLSLLHVFVLAPHLHFAFFVTLLLKLSRFHSSSSPRPSLIPLNNHNNSKPNWKISQIMYYIRIRIYHVAEENSVLWFAAAPTLLRGRKNCTRLEKLRVKIWYLIAVDSIDSCQLNGIDREKTASFHIEID